MWEKCSSSCLLFSLSMKKQFCKQKRRSSWVLPDPVRCVSVPLILAEVLPLSQPRSSSWDRSGHITQWSDAEMLGWTGRVDPIPSLFSFWNITCLLGACHSLRLREIANSFWDMKGAMWSVRTPAKLRGDTEIDVVGKGNPEKPHKKNTKSEAMTFSREEVTRHLFVSDRHQQQTKDIIPLMPRLVSW